MTLLKAMALLDLSPRRVAVAVLAGVATLGSALTLSALSAWLITRAWQMPPVLDLSVAVVAVRALGITRGLSRYVERLATHDVALRGTVSARANLYRILAEGDSAVTARLRRGDLLARTGADVDALGDVVIRAVVPISVAIVVGTASVGVVAIWSPTAAVVLAASLIVSGLIAPIMTAYSARTSEARASQSSAEFAAEATTVLDHAAELRVAGRLDDALDSARVAARDAVDAEDSASRTGAFAAAATPLAIGASVLGALVGGVVAFGSGTGFSGGTDPMALAIVVLLPLAAFEATAGLGAAAVALSRARSAAARIIDLQTRAGEQHSAGKVEIEKGRHSLRCEDLVSAHPGGSRTEPVSVTVTAGSRIAIVGPSGVGKSTLAATLAGLVPSMSGSVSVDGVDVKDIRPASLRGMVSYFAEDAHVFDTSVLENLRVVRGDVSEDEALALLSAVGLGEWVDALPDGVHTILAGGARAMSGGERRRLLLARVLSSPASILIVDEPTEHLDDASSTRILRALLDPDSSLVQRDRAVVVITHRPVPDGVETISVRKEKSRCRDREVRVTSLVHEEGGGLKLNSSRTREVAVS